MKALSTHVSGWSIASSNSFGTPCCQVISGRGFNCLPIMSLSKSITDLEYGTRGYTSSVPTETGLLTALTAIELNSNSLSGSLPTELGRLSMLSVGFLMYSNQFSGAIPSQLGGFTSLSSEFEVHGNDFTSTMPTELGRMTGMQCVRILCKNVNFTLVIDNLLAFGSIGGGDPH